MNRKKLKARSKLGIRLNVWKMNPIFWHLTSAKSFSDIFDVSAPSILMVPLVGLSRQPSRCKKVDFPDPLGPVIAIACIF
jgi:hypothetical protein